ncbi:hypothetical protein SAMN05444411_10382 [Lutibacter oricola]|uniref:Brp/Blh family beta-carotene 15,15'-monooxygenase n=1 Tax=Lutibacter oricola TaxID=762486 RepID=A0A1H2YWN1_9FLAO|nr:hypothetical protein [Lutibacter oricola]SDX09573.1 hypothetical protein SAMN05444411_10382 [Lutibacter oricola]
MSEKDYLQDLTEIKSIMNKSTRFISLSGMSGILAGVYALIGAFVGKFLINSYQQGETGIEHLPIHYFEILLLVVASIVLLLSVSTAFLLTSKKAKSNNEKIWTSTTRRLLKSFIVPLFTGGLLCIVLYQYNLIGLIAPFMLIFYGLSCVNASKYTLGNIEYLGMANIITGLIATQFIGYGIYFWALGFGVFHIIYGTLMYTKYDK